MPDVGRPSQTSVRFREALPIWPEGREREMNVLAGFRTVFKIPRNVTHLVLRITGSTHYRAFLDGEYLGHGPARGPRGFFRVDEWELPVEVGKHVIAIEACGYNANGYYVLNQPSFVQAEIEADGRILAATGKRGFEGTVLKHRIQKVQRYSFQRPFIEVYRQGANVDRWRSKPKAAFKRVRCARLGRRKLLPRGLPYPRLECVKPVQMTSTGRFEPDQPVEKPWRDRSLVNIGPKLAGFKEEDLSCVVSAEVQAAKTASCKKVGRVYSPSEADRVKTGEFRVLDLGTNLSGFIGLKVKCKKRSRLVLAYDELSRNGDVNFLRLGCCSAIRYDLGPGEHSLESLEPYVLRYLKLMVFEGACEISDVYLREYVSPDVSEAHFSASDERLNRLFEAGRQTSRQNCVDILMDCPSRERAGWLCDSFFSARAGMDLNGHAGIERNFLENFLLPPRFANLPNGMLPMNYPADFADGRFIPNWALWFVIELEEYLARTGDRALVDGLRPKLRKLLKYFDGLRNEYGLLEKLESWVFIEWSEANKFTQDVNYPSNMVYLGALEAYGRMYGDRTRLKEARRLRKVIQKQSFDGRFFVDNATREGKRLKITKNHSEACQYYAFQFDVATPATHRRLWNILRKDFGPKRHKTKAYYPEVHFANAFIGNVLRLEMLARHGAAQQMMDETRGYYLYMAERTGTLWEFMGEGASCNHGFASHICHALYRNVLGIRELDRVNRRVLLRFEKLKLSWCEGRVPVEGGAVSVRWRKKGKVLQYAYEVPSGYEVQVENKSGLKLAYSG